MERKVSRRGPNPDHLPLDKSMISAPTNFSHVGRSDPFRDRLGECADDETRVGGGVKDHRWAEVSEEERHEGQEAGEREGERQEVEQVGEYDPCSLSPPSPNTERRNSRRISKDMISLPMNFRHVLHIDPSSADPAHLSLLLKSGTELEYDLECDEEEENDDPAWPPPEPPIDYNEGPKGASDPAPAKPKPLRPSNRVRKSMISLPTNFQHVNHISAGERLLAPESPPPQVPPEPQPGEEGHEAGWGYEPSLSTPPIAPLPPSPPRISPYTASDVPFTPHTPPNHNYNTVNPYSISPCTAVPNLPTPLSPTYVNVPLPTTHHPHIPPPLTLPTSHAPHSPAPLSAPPHLGTARAKGHVTVGGPDQDQDCVRFRGGDSDFDFDIVQFRVPPPPPVEFSGNDTSRSSLPPRPRTHHQHLMEEEARREVRNDNMEEEEEEENIVGCE
uniref:CRIB domain-containing protein n=1 Tax=Scylla olivacea TaxID=85551 RepID=A0A0N7ZCG3_SCYOL